MATLDLRSIGGALRLTRNGGSVSVRSFMVIGPAGINGRDGIDGARGIPGANGAQGLPGPAGPVVAVVPGDLTLTDNNDGTATLATASGAVTDNNDGTATIAA